MKKILTSAVLLLLLCAQGKAQYDLQAEQRFNRKLPKRPLIGFELWRSFFPLMILQEPRNGGTLWLNQYKWTTIPSGIDQYYKELGEYEYDTIQKKWLVSRVDAYDINYDFTRKRVISAVVDKRYMNTTSNSTMLINYAFNSNHLPDTEFVQRKTGSSGYTPYVNFVFNYDANDLLTAVTYRYLASGFWFKTVYNYDQDNRLKEEITVSGNTPTSLPDSSSKLIYEYDSLARLSSFRTEVYEVIGSPYNWTTTNKTDYVYDGSSNTIIKNTKWTYDAADDYTLKKSDEFEYTYTSQGYPETFIQTSFNPDAVILGRSRWVMSYLNNEPDFAYEYVWNGISYDPSPAYRYLFKETNTGLNQEYLNGAGTVKVFPNPVHNKLFITSQELPDHIELIDVTGKRFVKETNIIDQSVDLGGLPSGIYMVILHGKGIKIYKD